MREQIILKVSRLALGVHKKSGDGQEPDDVAIGLAKMALDLTKDAPEPLVLSSGGVSIGDSVRLRETIKKDRYTLPKDTKGHIVGFTKDGKYLCLLFPTFYQDGVLSIHEEKDLHVLHKPQVADDHLYRR